MNQKIVKVSVYAGIFLLFAGTSHILFRNIHAKSPSSTPPVTSKTPTPTAKQTGSLQFSGPKTEVCPINGELFTKEEKAIWEKRRPLMVMIENHEDSRPQSGLQNADIVYEAVAEGGITRFMGVFYCNAVKGSTNKYDLGPVRSARTYFLDLASEYSDYPLYTHVGGANCGAPQDPATGMVAGPCTTNVKAQAIEQISQYGWNNKGTWSDLSQFSLPYKACRREPERTGEERDTEHTMYCSSNVLWDIAADRGLTNQTIINKTSWDKSFSNWSFKKDDKTQAASAAQSASFDFWSGYKQYSVSWQYDSKDNQYLRSNGGKPHLDFNTQEQLSAKNIVIQFVKETRSVDMHLHNLYEVIGKGKGVLLQNGTKTDITWSKASRTARTQFKDASTGKNIDLVPGRVWVELVPLNTTINYEGL
jgi:hypothetical protein